MAPRRKRAVRAISEEDVVTMSTLRELLDNQKKEFTSLMEIQRRNFTSHIETVMDTTNRRIDDLVRKVQAVKGSLQYSQREIGGVKSSSQEQEQRIKDIESQIAQFRSDIHTDPTRDGHSDSQSHRDDHSDSQSHRNDHSDSHPRRDGHSDSQSHRDDHSDSQSHRNDHLDSQSRRDDQSDSQSHIDDHSDSQSCSSSYSLPSPRRSSSYDIDNCSDLEDFELEVAEEFDRNQDYSQVVYDDESDGPSDNQMDNVYDNESEDGSDVEKKNENDIWQLPVKGPDGSTIFIRIHKDATVDEVISQISKRKSIRMEQLCVMYTTDKLEYGQGKRLSDYHIEDMYTLHYTVSGAKPPLFKQRCPSPQEQQEADKTTNGSDMDEDSNIWQLTAKLNDTNAHHIRIKKDATVDELIEKISDRIKIPIESQSIIFTTKRLEYGQGKQLSDYGIQDKSTMFVVLRLEVPSLDSLAAPTDLWQLSIKDNTGFTYHIRIHKDTIVDKLIDKISEANGSPRERMTFVYKRNQKSCQLEYGKRKRLTDYGIQDKSTIEIIFRTGATASESQTSSTPHVKVKQEEDVKAADASESSNIWQLTVCHLSGRKDNIIIHKHATVDRLMDKISERSGIPTVQMRNILYRGQKLYQGRRLSDYPLQNNSTLFLGLRL